MKMKDKDDGFFGVLSNIIDEAFTKVFTEKNKDEPRVESQYSSIEAYTESTGKRFRMSKDQKNRGLTREEAFVETHLNEEK